MADPHATRRISAIKGEILKYAMPLDILKHFSGDPRPLAGWERAAVRLRVAPLLLRLGWMKPLLVPKPIPEWKGDTIRFRRWMPEPSQHDGMLPPAGSGVTHIDTQGPDHG